MSAAETLIPEGSADPFLGDRTRCAVHFLGGGPQKFAIKTASHVAHRGGRRVREKRRTPAAVDNVPLADLSS